MSRRYQQQMEKCEAGNCQHSLGRGVLTEEEILSGQDGPQKKQLPGLDENGNPLSRRQNNN